MPAPSGNTNASKWTLEATLQTLARIEDYAYDEHILTLGRALQFAEVYPGVWSYWKKRWIHNEEIMEKIGFIDGIFINKLMEGGMTKRLHAGMCMFALRFSHGMVEKTQKPEVQEEEDKIDDSDIPPHLRPSLQEARDQYRDPSVPRPLPKWARRFPHIFSNRPPADGRPYTRMGDDLYASHGPVLTEEELEKLGVVPPPGSPFATGFLL